MRLHQTSEQVDEGHSADEYVRLPVGVTRWADESFAGQPKRALVVLSGTQACQGAPARMAAIRSAAWPSP